jgi:MoaA/NifB/PqqE/SkfB family radical SAM enzyme
MFKKPDMVLYLLISQMCNIRCRFCYQENFESMRLSDDILYNKLKELYQRVAFLPIVGGEVTIVPGMKEYITWLKENYPHIDVLIGTNGVAFDDEWIELTRKYGLLINYSLNAVREETYEKILVSGNSNKIFSAIHKNYEKLWEIHMESERPLLNEVSMVVTDYTADDVEDFIKHALAKGINPMIRFDVKKGNAITPKILEAEETAMRLKVFCEDYITVTPWHHPHYIEEGAIYDSIRRNHADEKEKFLLKNEKRRARWQTRTYIDYMPKSVSCPVINHAISVGYDGSVVPCYNLPNYVLGNIYYDNLEDLLYGEKMRTIQNQIKHGNYKYCFDRCPMNCRPKTSQNGSELKFEPQYKKLFLNGDYENAAVEYERIINTPLMGAQQAYEYAYCLHVVGTELEKAVEWYNIALEKGFDEYWVCYNRSDAYKKLGMQDEAKIDADRAQELRKQMDGENDV